MIQLYINMDFELDKNIYNSFKKMISSCMNNKDYELEVRFGKYINNSSFSPGIDYNLFKKILEELYSNKNFKFIQDYDILTIGPNNRDNNLYKCVKNIDSIKKICQKEDFINDDTYILEKTKRLETLDINDYNIRIEKSTEKILDLDTQYKIIDNPNKFYRYKKRYSFESIDSNFRIDISITKNSPNHDDTKKGIMGYSSFRESNVLNKPNNFEIEIEYLPQSEIISNKKMNESEKIDKLTNNFLSNINHILKYIQNTDFPMSITTQNNIFDKYVKSFLIDNSNKNIIFTLPRNKKNFFLGADTNVLRAENLIKKEDLDHDFNYINDKYPNDYAVTVKADGERVLIFIDNDGYIYLINNRIDFKDTGLRVDKDVGNTLIDGEYLEDTNTLLAFDLLFYNSIDYRTRILFRLGSQDLSLPESRYEKLSLLIEKFKIMKKKYASNYKSSFIISLKKHYFPVVEKKDILKLSSELWNKRDINLNYNIDGLIYTPRNEQYHNVNNGFRWKNNLKWKPLKLTSIDFLVHIKKDQENRDFLKPFRFYDEKTKGYKIKYYKTAILKVGQRVGKNYMARYFNPITGSEYREGMDCFIARIFTDNNKKIYANNELEGTKEEIQDGNIVEFIYNKQNSSGFEWEPIRIRHDKTEILKRTGSISSTANDIQIATSIWNSYHEYDGKLLDENIFEIIENDYYYQRIKEEVNNKVSKYYTHDDSGEKSDVLDERSRSIDSNIRNFNNHIKHRLYKTVISHYRNKTGINDISLLDLGAGKGGDLNKYITNNISKVHALDYDKVNISNLKARYNILDNKSQNILKQLETYVGDFSKLMNNGDASHNKDVESKNKLINFYKTSGFSIFNIISCQFAIHYSFENEISMRGLIHNIYNNLPIGGLFFGTCFDGKRMFDLLKKNKGHVSGDINDRNVYEVKMDPKSTFKNVGTEIEFKFSSINDNFMTEYLVNFDYFIQVMKDDYDINIITDEEAKEMDLPGGLSSFEEIYNEQNKFVLDETEKQLVFNYYYFVFKKTGTGDGKEIAKWNKMLAL